MSNRLKVMTVVGTRPEIIRLAATIKLLDETTEHTLVHTGQNYDYELNEIFFEDLGLKRPDYFLNADTTSLGATLGTILQGTEKVISEVRPDAMLVLGDTNSCIAAVMGKRMRVPVYHMEAGNRCFDQNVPEETNRKLVDHVADYNLVYSEHARRNLLSEGIHPSQLLLTGSPMKEVLSAHQEEFEASNIIEEQGLSRGEYFLVSLHREENVDNPNRLSEALAAFNLLYEKYKLPILVSTHPRTKKQLEKQPAHLKSNLKFHQPFGFIDYVALQMNAKVVLSDSGTISEESSILGFPAITMRDAIERPEAQDEGAIVLTGVNPDRVLTGVELVLSLYSHRRASIPYVYEISNVSQRVVTFIVSTAQSHHDRVGIKTSS